MLPLTTRLSGCSWGSSSTPFPFARWLKRLVRFLEFQRAFHLNEATRGGKRNFLQHWPASADISCVQDLHGDHDRVMVALPELSIRFHLFGSLGGLYSTGCQ